MPVTENLILGIKKNPEYPYQQVLYQYLAFLVNKNPIRFHHAQAFINMSVPWNSQNSSYI